MKKIYQRADCYNFYHLIRTLAELVVMYGRRRVGKSAILAKFGVAHNAIFFDGLEREPLHKLMILF